MQYSSRSKEWIHCFLDRRYTTFSKIVFLVFALRAIDGGMLAFASNDYMPVLRNFMVIVAYSTIPLGMLYVAPKLGHINKQDARLLLLPIVYFMFLLLHTYGGYGGDWITSFIAISCFCLMERKDKAIIFDYFYWIIMLLNVFSILAYIIIVLKLPFGVEYVPYYTGNDCYYGKWLIFAVLEEGLGRFRLCGVFNEPGGLGTICSLLFVAKYSKCTKIEKIILVITTILSFSLAGFLILFIFASIKLLTKNIKTAFLIIPLVILFVNLPKIDFGNPFLNSVAYRFSIIDGQLAGNDRYGLAFKNMYNEFKTTSSYYLGLGAGVPISRGVSTYKQLIFEYGIIGFGLLLLMFVVESWKRSLKNREALIFALLFLVSIYQRPLAIVGILGYVLLFGGIDNILEESGRLVNNDW